MNIRLNCYLSLCATPAMDLDRVYLCNVVSTSHTKGNKYIKNDKELETEAKSDSDPTNLQTSLLF